MKAYTQDAHETITYRAVPTSGTIASATATITPTGPTLGAITNLGTEAYLKVSVLTAGSRYVLELLATLTSGDIRRFHCAITGE